MNRPPRTGDVRLGLGLTYFFYFFFSGINLPYFGIWLHDNAISVEQVAILSSLLLTSKTIGQFIIPYIFVRSKGYNPLIFCAPLSFIATAVLLPWHGGFLIYVSTVVGGIFIGAMIPLTDSLAIGSEGISFGHIRLWGSIGFAIANLLGGVIVDRLGNSSVVDLESLSLLALSCSSLYLVSRTHSGGDTVVPGTIRSDHAEFARVVLSRPFWLLTLSVAAISSSHAFVYTFGSLYWSRELHLDKAIIGCLWATGVASEIIILRTLGSRRSFQSGIVLMLAGGMGATLRWTVMAASPPLPILFACQLLHGLSFGATLLGGYQVLRRLSSIGALPAVVGVYAAMVNGVVIGLVTAMLSTFNAMEGTIGLTLMAAMALVGTLGVVLLSILWTKAPKPEPA